ncbi:MAG: Rrf2 family transcriptional regulator [Helicobacteraceae bacterium]|nr:Rrf2 family transcriptional regulator [Helicobacteraceae bacterium]
MVNISTKGIYAVAAMHALSHSPNNRSMQIKEISAMTQISHGYLEQILSQLKKSSLVTSTRGAKGGYKLSRPANKIIILEVVEALEGELFSVHENVGATVVLEAFWADMQDKLRNLFSLKLSELDQAYQPFCYDI